MEARHSMSRTRTLYRTNAVTGEVERIDVSPDYQSTPDRAPLFTDRYMEGHQAQDGTDISSRSKRRDYMKANNLADYGDFEGVRARADKERAAFYDPNGKHDTQSRRESIARAMESRNRR
jgi:hypothetical protein